MRAVLGFDTSCYTTSAAVVDENGKVAAFARQLLPVETGQCGLRQSEAVFAHVRQMPEVMRQIGNQLAARPDVTLAGVAVSRFPRDAENSYMPVFQVGFSHAQTVASVLDLPLVETSHQAGHIAAGLIGVEQAPRKFVALHLSGGTTELLSVDGENIQRMGGCLDLHAGQMVDRIGVALGLSFPSGPSLEKLATACPEPTTALLPLSMEQKDLQCHFSGAETKAQQLIASGAYSPERVAAETYDVLARTVARLLAAGCAESKTDTALVVGGVASSTLLRQLLTARLNKNRAKVQVLFGQPQYSGDNAAGVAWIGVDRLLK